MLNFIITIFRRALNILCIYAIKVFRFIYGINVLSFFNSFYKILKGDASGMALFAKAFFVVNLLGLYIRFYNYTVFSSFIITISVLISPFYITIKESSNVLLEALRVSIIVYKKLVKGFVCLVVFFGLVNFKSFLSIDNIIRIIIGRGTYSPLDLTSLYTSISDGITRDGKRLGYADRLRIYSFITSYLYRCNSTVEFLYESDKMYKIGTHFLNKEAGWHVRVIESKESTKIGNNIVIPKHFIYDKSVPTVTILARYVDNLSYDEFLDNVRVEAMQDFLKDFHSKSYGKGSTTFYPNSCRSPIRDILFLFKKYFIVMPEFDEVFNKKLSKAIEDLHYRAINKALLPMIHPGSHLKGETPVGTFIGNHFNNLTNGSVYVMEVCHLTEEDLDYLSDKSDYVRDAVIRAFTTYEYYSDDTLEVPYDDFTKAPLYDPTISTDIPSKKTDPSFKPLLLPLEEFDLDYQMVPRRWKGTLGTLSNDYSHRSKNLEKFEKFNKGHIDLYRSVQEAINNLPSKKD